MHQIALPQWPAGAGSGIFSALGGELHRNGQEVLPFPWDGRLPDQASVLLCFGPYGRMLPMLAQAAGRNPRPLILHWNLEPIPDYTLPWSLLDRFGRARLWLDQLNERGPAWLRRQLRQGRLSGLNERLGKWRNLGVYHGAYRQGQLDCLLDCSRLYASFHRQHGLRVRYIHYATLPKAYATLGLERDIDVLWIGKQRTRRRARLLRQVRQAVESQGLRMLVCDGVENPFIFGTQRTQILNRTKVTLHINPTWWDHAFSFRYHLAAANRSLVVSETNQAHYPEYIPGVHYVSVPAEQLAQTVIEYVRRPEAGQAIVENAYRQVTEELTFSDAVRQIIQTIDELQAGSFSMQTTPPGNETDEP